MITRTTAYTIDLDKPTVEDRWDAPLTYGDKGANIINATLTRGSSAATLSGLTAILYGVLSNGTTAVRAGSVTDNVVTVELDSSFYAIPGKIDLLLQLAEGTAVINTPLRITAYVKSGQTDELVSTGEQFSLAELQAIAAACEAATLEATAAATAIEEMTVEATAVSPGGTPTIAISDVGDHKHIAFGVPSGLKGDMGASITAAAFSGDDIVFTKNDTTTVTLEDAKPALKGDTGDPITVYRGSAITGTSTTPAVYATGITLAVKDAIYIYDGSNSADIGNEYICTLGGDAATALWAFLRNTRGEPGAGNVSYVDELSPGGNGNVALGALRYNAEMTLTPEEKGQARANAGAQEQINVTGMAKFDGAGGASEAVAGTDYRAVQVEAAGTLAAASWTGTAAPYSQTVAVAGMLATSTGVDVGLSSTATQAQREAARAALLMATAYDDDTVTVVADGELPTVDLPIIVRRDS